MSGEIIVGICRFSYLGLGDWTAYRQDKNTEASRLDEIARTLYADERMAARFRAFETLCLPSITAQTDHRFIFLIVSSPDMPRHWRDRLHMLCDPHDNIQILWSGERQLAEALEPTLRELYDMSDGSLWQFRLDDDDALDADFVPRLRSHLSRMDGLPEGAISMARGLHVALYDDEPTTFLEHRQAFWGAGLALKLARPGLSIFRFGHFALRERFSHFVDRAPLASLILKWPSDSVKLNLDKLPAHTWKIDEGLFQRYLASHYPFLEGVDFDRLRPPPAETPETTTGDTPDTGVSANTS